jgi:hypothetical protein
MTTYKIHYSSDIWETVEVEADSKEKAEEMFHSGEINLSDAEEHGKENLTIDRIEEV